MSASWTEALAAAHVPPYDIPAIQRWSQARLGLDGDGLAAGLIGRFLPDRHDLVALSVGCGIGGKERALAASGRVARIDAFDISEELVRSARERAQRHGVGELIRFSAQDARTYSAPPAGYDVIIFDSSLHHISGLEEFVPKAASWLRPEGIVVLQEYVGPRRWQWSDRQVELAGEWLTRIPERLRTTLDGHVKSDIGRPGRLRMWFVDPSEAVESDSILPLMAASLDELWREDMGGTLWNLVFDGIAHHFTGDDPEAARIVGEVLADEQRRIVAGEIPSDNVVAVYGWRQAATGTGSASGST